MKNKKTEIFSIAMAVSRKMKDIIKRKDAVTICITFPRSGHHLLVNSLLKYCGNDVYFQQTQGEDSTKLHKNILVSGELHYCEYYNHCNTQGCVNRKTNLQKNHDFELTLPKSKNYKYIIQYRHPIESIVSWYIMRNKKSLKYNFEDFLMLKIEFWRKFVQKWTLDSDKDEKMMHLQYAELIKYPNKELTKVINFLYPERQVDSDLLESIITEMDIQPKNNITESIYYNEKLFRKVEKSILTELRQLNIDPLFTM